MIKVITYGTYDLLHYGHIRLLERAKAFGDYLIVGVTSDDYDKARGKINNRQSLMERIEAIKATGLADEVIVEEYDGQKIDDIRKYGVDVFAMGSDWEGKFDYLKEFCKVIYLPRTEGISSSEIRSSEPVRVRIVGERDTDLTSIAKFMRECEFVNGIELVDSDECDAVYVCSQPSFHYNDVKSALLASKHVLCESPIALSDVDYRELIEIAENKGCVLMDGIKTAYATAYERLVLLAKSGKIGEVLSVDATCTSIKKVFGYTEEEMNKNWNTITEWGPIALLPIFQILGTDFDGFSITSRMLDKDRHFDVFTKIDFTYPKSVASLKVAKSAKSEGELVVTGTNGYIYVPAPWWKTDYFELRFEDQSNNRRYYYQLDGEGIRYEMAAFIKSIQAKKALMNIDSAVSSAICSVMKEFYENNMKYI